MVKPQHKHTESYKNGHKSDVQECRTSENVLGESQIWQTTTQVRRIRKNRCNPDHHDWHTTANIPDNSPIISEVTPQIYKSLSNFTKTRHDTPTVTKLTKTVPNPYTPKKCEIFTHQSGLFTYQSGLFTLLGFSTFLARVLKKIKSVKKCETKVRKCEKVWDTVRKC